jgi:hypothetical protein
MVCILVDIVLWIPNEHISLFAQLAHKTLQFQKGWRQSMRDTMISIPPSTMVSLSTTFFGKVLEVSDFSVQYQLNLMFFLTSTVTCWASHNWKKNSLLMSFHFLYVFCFYKVKHICNKHKLLANFSPMGFKEPSTTFTSSTGAFTPCQLLRVLFCMSFSFTILSYSTQYNNEADPFFPLKVLFVVSNSVSPPNKNS